MDPNDQHLFVIRPVENADLSSLRHNLMGPPKIIVVQFLVTRRLEGMYVASLRIHAGHDVFNGGVFAGRVHTLKNEEQSPAILGIELFLHLANDRTAFLEQVLSMLLG